MRFTIYFSGYILVLHIRYHFSNNLYTFVYLPESPVNVNVSELQRTQKCQLTQEILHISEVIEETNWISCYSQHGDLHEVDKSLGWWLL